MRRILLTALPAFLAGALATAVVLERGWTPLRGKSATAIEDVPAVSLAEAESQRQANFSDVRSIEDVLALPGAFARNEALYVLAGRSDSATIQDLIFQASGIADPGNRLDFLQVLFSRLAELDPPSALALARTRDFRAEPALEASVWQSWGRLDLEAALHAAARGDAAHRELAAQALLAANGYRGNERTRRIADVLGVELSREAQAVWLQRLAADDPAAAFAHVGTLEGHAQERAAAALGEFLGRTGLDAAMRHRDRLPGREARRAFAIAAARASARLDPAAALDVLLSGPLVNSMYEHPAETLSAMRQIIEQDLDSAMAYFEQLDVPQQRQHVANNIVRVLARRDPAQALAWARSNDHSMHGQLHASALASIALEHPELAVDEALRIPHHRQRENALNWVVRSLGGRDPRRAVEMLEQIGNRGNSEQLAQSVTSMWLQSDPDAALEWLLGLDETRGGRLLVQAGQTLPQTDVDAAIRLLPRLDEQAAAAWRFGIASSLAAHRSAAEAERFIARFEGTRDYPQLQIAAIAGVAQTDVDAALRMARQLPPGPEKTSTYNNLVVRLASEDPRRAAELLSSIDDEGARANVVGAVASQWSRADTPAAEQWVENLPRGAGRDNAVRHLASNWDELTPSRRRLLESVGSDEVRKQALFSHAWRLSHRDPEAAERLIHSMNMNDRETQQMLDTLAKNSRRTSHWGMWR